MRKRLVNFFLHSSIKMKLELMVMMITFITLLIASSVFMGYDYITAKRAAVQELTLLGEIIGKRIAPLMIFEDTDKASKILADLSSKRSVILSCVYTSDGRLIATYRQAGILNVCPEQKEKTFSSNALMVSQKISTLDGSSAGALLILSDMRDLSQHFLRSAVGMFMLILAAMGVTYLMTMKMQGIIFLPILNLANSARDVSENKNYSLRATRFYNDELGTLVDAFNGMMVEVEKRDKALLDVNETLEIKVQERTRALEEAKTKAECANEAKNEFLRYMSHEFRTPLHAMTSFSLFGISETEADQAQEDLNRYFSNIHKSSQRLMHLVDGMLNIARLESGQELLFMQPANLKAIADTVITEQEGLLQQKNITLSYLNADIDTNIVCDEVKIMQVITNIVGNAIKFTPKGKAITLRFSREEMRLAEKAPVVPVLLLSVADQGVGIPEGEQEKIFEKFVQSTRTNSGAGGTGLGLTISKGMILAHQGKIWAENNVEGGASFTFALPLNVPEGQFIVTL